MNSTITQGFLGITIPAGADLCDLLFEVEAPIARIVFACRTAEEISQVERLDLPVLVEGYDEDGPRMESYVNDLIHVGVDQ